MTEKTRHISHEMTVLDIISRYRETEAVFKRYDQKTGECICCQALFDKVRDMAQRYKLNLETLMIDLKSVIDGN